MSNPRIEEVDDDDVEDVEDPEEMDVEAFDFSRPQKGTLKPAMDPPESQMSPEAVQSMMQPQSEPNGTNRQSTTAQMSDQERERVLREQRERTKNYQCIYPIYFDATRSRVEGRRVKKSEAVENPLAREIVEALQHVGNSLGVGLQIVFEPSKTHPKDWANPGRVKVQVKRDGKPVSPKLQGKHQLYKLVADYLQRHPTTEEAPFKFQPQGLPVPKDDKYPPPAIPRGFKMGRIVPLHSPALSGGGVSDNFLKDMMTEMGGELPPGMQNMANMGAGGNKPQKVRIKKGK